MAFTLIDGGNQIILDARTGSPAANVNFGPPCQMKVVDFWWQDYISAGDVLQFQDAKGRPFAMKGSTDLVPIHIGKLDWVEGPFTLTSMTSGLAYCVLGNK